MKKKFLFSIISSFFIPCAVFCFEEIDDKGEDFPQIDGDQSIFNEESERENSDEDTVNLFQVSTESIQQILSDNIAVLNMIKKFVLSIFQEQSDFELKEFMDQYICCKKIQYLSWRDLQKYDHPFEIVDCFIDFGKINNLKTVESAQTLFFVKSLIYEFLATRKIQKNDSFKYRNIIDKDLVNKALMSQKTRQRLNKFVKDSFGVKKNIDCCPYLNFVIVNFKNTFSVESLERLFSKYSFLNDNQDFEVIKNSFSNFIQNLRTLDADNDEFQSSIDVVSQNISKNPKLIKNFLISLVDKPIYNLHNSDFENFLRNKFQK